MSETKGSDMSIGWAIIGPGSIADEAIAPAISELEGGELVAVLSRDPSRAEAFARKHGSAASYTSLDAMLADDRVDVVYIGSPNALHVEQVVAAAAAGKHVFCDKPLATDLAGARRAVAACEAAGVLLGINFQSRHHRFVAELRSQLAAGVVGKVLVAEIEVSPGNRPLGSWRTDPGLAGLGTVNNLGVHAFDLLGYLLDSEVVEVTTMFDVGRRVELETIALVLLRFANGTLAYANANQAIRFCRNDLVLYGSAGRIVGESVTRPAMDGCLTTTTSESESTTETTSRDAFARSVGSFQESVRSGSTPNASGLDGLASVQLTSAIELSAREGRTVLLEEVAAG